MNTKYLAAVAAVTLALSAGAATAQAPSDTMTTSADVAVAPVEEDDGMDLGWLGLLGLIGLLGLKKRKDDHVRTHSTSPGTVGR